MLFFYFSQKPASAAQLDVRRTGDKEIVGSITAIPAVFFCEDWSWNIFYGHSLPSVDSRAVVSFWQKNMHKHWLTTEG